jgi:HAD superfamily hydrolase (TIGR01509 family)
VVAVRNIHAIGFDFDHTLGIDNKLERVAFLHLLDEICRQGGHPIGTLADEIERIDELLEQQRAAAFTIEEAVERFARERGVSDGSQFVDGYKRMAIDMVPWFVIPQPGVRAMLQVLRERRIPCAILTNGWSPLQQYKARRVQFEGPLVVSADLGIQKPEPLAFEALAQALGAQAHEIAYVGDTPASDVAGALAAGMQAIWFDAQGVCYPAELPPPTAVIHRLEELPALL